jgi:predicted nucleic acid-binding protein
VKAQDLVDKSALARMPIEAVRRQLAPIIESGEAATCALIDLEVLLSARNYEEHERIRHRKSPTTWLPPALNSRLMRDLDGYPQLA